MYKVNIKSGLKLKILDQIFEVIKLLSNGNVQVQNCQFGDFQIYSQCELIKLLSEGKLVFECHGKNVELSSDSINTTYDFEDLESSKYKQVAIFRYEVIKPLLEIPYCLRKRSHIKARVVEINNFLNNHNSLSNNFQGVELKKASVPTVYRWLSDYERSGGDIRSLIPSYHRSGGPNRPRINAKIVEFIKESINQSYLNSQQITVKEVYYEVIHKINEDNQYSINPLPFPSYPTIARYIAKIPESELVLKRIGKRRAEQRFNQIGDGVTVKYPLERVEIDSTDLDLLIVGSNGLVIGRPHFIVAIDKFTRHILGFSLGFNGVGWPEVMQCLRHVMTDKTYVNKKYPFINNRWNAFGVPKKVVVDNGLGFKNNPMKDASYQLGFVLHFAPPRVPEWKGSIERFFGTANTSFTHTLPGTTRSNPKKLGEIENPSKNACLPFGIFLGLLHKWVVDIYSQDLNKGAGGIPSLIWEKCTSQYPVAWPNSIQELAIILGRIDYRVITNKGIELNCLFYNSFELNQLFIKFSSDNKGQEQKFKVKYDPQNVGSIFVYDHLITRKWIEVPAVNQDYAQGLSEWEHSEIRKYSRQEFGKVDILSLAESKAFLRKQIESWSGFSKKQLAKANRINSESEIFKTDNVDGSSRENNNLQANIRLPNPVEQNDNNDDVNNYNNISDLGAPFYDFADLATVSKDVVEKSKMGVILDLDLSKSKPKKRNKHVNKKSGHENYFNETTLDLSGFGIFTELEGE